MIYVGIVVLAIVVVIDVMALMQYRKFIKCVTADLNKYSVDYVSADWSVLAQGHSSDIELERAWLRAAQEMFNLFVRKNHDYGPKNLAMGGTQGVVLRLGDKVSRLWQLVGLDGSPKDPHVKDEKRADAFLDSGNYNLVGYLMEIGQWPKHTVVENIGYQAAALFLQDVAQQLPEAIKDDVMADLTK